VTPEALERWLAGRRPAAPPALADRLGRAVREAPRERLAAAATRAEALAALGQSLLARVVERDPQQPDLALDLLAADALVTYAVEAAAEEGISAGRLASGILETAVSG
jgi:hypothetical protein